MRLSFYDLNMENNLYLLVLLLCTVRASYSQYCPTIYRGTNLKIDCESKGLTELPADITTALNYSYDAELIDLDCRHNLITTIPPGFFESLTSSHKIDTLDFSTNQLKSLKNGMFAGLSGLKILNLEENQINNIEEGTFADLPLLNYLIFKDNPLSKITTNMFSQLTSLYYLTLRNCQITQIEKGAFGLLNEIGSIDVSMNFLSSIVAGIFDVQDLESSPSTFTWFSSLNLSSNSLSSIEPGTFQRLNKLENLYLYNNNFTSIAPNVFDGLDTVFYLRCSYNFITSLESGNFKSLLNLRTLNLKNNRISSININAFEGLNFLDTLVLSENSISYITGGTLDSLKKLSFLSLSYNQFKTIGNYFAGLQSLLELELDHNIISNIEEGTLDDLTNLITVSISSNNLSSLPGNLFSRLSNLKTLSLGDNPWDCTCEGGLGDYQAWILFSNNTDLFDLDCQKPFIQLLSSADLCRPPTIMSENNFLNEVFLGDQVVLECLAAGVPEPVVSWKLPFTDNPQGFNEDGYEYTARTVNGVGWAKVKIRNVQLMHQGVYICWANNSNGVEKSEGNLMVLQTKTDGQVSPKHSEGITTKKTQAESTFTAMQKTQAEGIFTTMQKTQEINIRDQDTENTSEENWLLIGIGISVGGLLLCSIIGIIIFKRVFRHGRRVSTFSQSRGEQKKEDIVSEVDLHRRESIDSAILQEGVVASDMSKEILYANLAQAEDPMMALPNVGV